MLFLFAFCCSFIHFCFIPVFIQLESFFNILLICSFIHSLFLQKEDKHCEFWKNNFVNIHRGNHILWFFGKKTFGNIHRDIHELWFLKKHLAIFTEENLYMYCEFLKKHLAIFTQENIYMHSDFFKKTFGNIHKGTNVHVLWIF